MEQEFVGKCRKSHGFILIYFIPLIGLTAHHHILHPRRRGWRKTVSFFRDHPDHRSDRTSLASARPRPAALLPFAFQPAIDKAEVLATVINLQCNRTGISGPLRQGLHISCAGSGRVSLYSPRWMVIGGVIHAEQHLPIQFIYPANRAVQSCGTSTGCRAVIRAACGPAAAKRPGCRCARRQLPEGLGDDAHADARKWRAGQTDGHRRRSCWASPACPPGLKQTASAAINPSAHPLFTCGKGAVYQQHPAGLRPGRVAAG